MSVMTRRRGSLTAVQMEADPFHKPHLNALTGLQSQRYTLMRSVSSHHLCELPQAQDFTPLPNEKTLVVRILSATGVPKGTVVSLRIPGTKGVADGRHPIQTMAADTTEWGEELYVPLEIRQTPETSAHCGHHHTICTQVIPAPFTLQVTVGAPSRFMGHIVPGVLKPLAHVNIAMGPEQYPEADKTPEGILEPCKWEEFTKRTLPLTCDICQEGRHVESATITMSWALTHVPAGSFVRSTLEADLLPVEKRLRPKIEAQATRAIYFKDFLNSLDTGDIFLTIPDPISNIRVDTLHSVSNHFTGSEYVHMGMIIRQEGSRGAKFRVPPRWTIPDFSQGQLQVAESTMGRDGVWCYSLEYGFVKTAIFDDYIMVRKLQGVERTHEWRMKVEALLEKWVGTPFDGGKRGALEMLNASRKTPDMAEQYELQGHQQIEMVEENKKTRRKLFCSEFVSIMFQQLGILPEGPETRSDFFTPGAYTREMGTVDKLMAIHGSGASLGPEMLLRYPGSAFELQLRKMASLRAGSEFLDEHALSLT